MDRGKVYDNVLSTGFLLTGSMYSTQQIGPLWWLCVNPDVTNFTTGADFCCVTLCEVLNH